MDNIKDIFNKKTDKKSGNIARPPAYEWQNLALGIIKELNIPNFKRSSVFKVCKVNSKTVIERAVNDTKELCKEGEMWKYFFKVLSGK